MAVALSDLKLTRNALLLKYKHQDGIRQERSTTIVNLSLNGINQKKLLGWWRFSPDGQYAVSSGHSVSAQFLRVIRTDTFTKECSDITQMDLNHPLKCPFLQLHNGKWWSPTKGVVLDKPVPAITDAISPPYRSPDEKWYLMQTHPPYLDKSGWFYGKWSVMNVSSNVNWSFEIPTVVGHYCSVGTYYSWHTESTLFAIHHHRQNHTFVWKFVDSNQPPKLVNVIDHGTTCTNNKHWDRMEFLGPWE